MWIHTLQPVCVGLSNMVFEPLDLPRTEEKRELSLSWPLSVWRWTRVTQLLEREMPTQAGVYSPWPGLLS